MGCQTALKPTVSGEGIGGCARPWPDVSCRASGWCAALPMTRIWASRDSGGGGSRLEHGLIRTFPPTLTTMTLNHRGHHLSNSFPMLLGHHSSLHSFLRHSVALHAQARQLARHGRVRTRRTRVAVSESPHRRQGEYGPLGIRAAAGHASNGRSRPPRSMGISTPAPGLS
jgi:hypothetical protein